ncbi:MAG: hypothetical protein QNK27_07360 [Desulfuromusa sp.]|nr:hypothetical protein [Desulfuromusa sp.]
MEVLIYNKKKIVATGYKICCSIFLLTLFIFIAPVSAAEEPRLQADDCEKCHAFQLRMITQDGGKHATEIGCLDCHPQHPPNGKINKNPCILCHEGQAHFQVGDCQHCHTNPHKPLVSLRDSLKPERSTCLSCHAAIGQQMAVAPSRHSKLFCNRCHSRHKEIPSCLDCHEPHRSGQIGEDCSKCHPAHQTLKVEPTGYLPTSLCQPCHKKQTNDLTGTKTNPGGINCVYFHKGTHQSIPRCQDCHGFLHNQSIHSQFRDYLECHGDPHRLISNQ